MYLQEGFVVYEVKRLPDALGQVNAMSPLVLKEIMLDTTAGKVPMPAFTTEEDAMGYINTQVVARTVTILKVYQTSH